jgi:hypothetical protein
MVRGEDCSVHVATLPSKIRDRPCRTHTCVQLSLVMEEKHFNFRCILGNQMDDSEGADFLVFVYGGLSSLLSP